MSVDMETFLREEYERTRPRGMDEEEHWFFHRGELDMFIRISTAYHGKQYYFLQENGKVYSRSSGYYLDFEEAVAEFIKEVSGE